MPNIICVLKPLAGQVIVKHIILNVATCLTRCGQPLKHYNQENTFPFKTRNLYIVWILLVYQEKVMLR